MNNKTTIVRGEKINLSLFIVDENDRPKNLTDFDEICFCIKKDDGTTLEKKLTTGGEITVDNVVLGEFTVHLLSVDTNALSIGDKQSFDVKITNTGTGELRIVKYEEALNIETNICP